MKRVHHFRTFITSGLQRNFLAKKQISTAKKGKRFFFNGFAEMNLLLFLFLTFHIKKEVKHGCKYKDFFLLFVVKRCRN